MRELSDLELSAGRIFVDLFSRRITARMGSGWLELAALREEAADSTAVSCSLGASRHACHMQHTCAPAPRCAALRWRTSRPRGSRWLVRAYPVPSARRVGRLARLFRQIYMRQCCMPVGCSFGDCWVFLPVAAAVVVRPAGTIAHANSWSPRQRQQRQCSRLCSALHTATHVPADCRPWRWRWLVGASVWTVGTV